MAAFTRAFLFCDSCGAPFDMSAVPSAETVDEARKLARARGWHLAKRPGTKSRDICPDDWANGLR